MKFLFIGIISRHSDAFNSSYLSQLDLLIELLESWPEYANYANKLRSLRPHLIERMRRAFDVNPNHFNTLIHGDMFVHFRYFLFFTGLFFLLLFLDHFTKLTKYLFFPEISLGITIKKLLPLCVNYNNVFIGGSTIY